MRSVSSPRVLTKQIAKDQIANSTQMRTAWLAEPWDGQSQRVRIRTGRQSAAVPAKVVPVGLLDAAYPEGTPVSVRMSGGMAEIISFMSSRKPATLLEGQPRVIPIMMGSVFTTSSDSFVNIPGLAFPVISGRKYLVRNTFRYSVGNAATGIAVAFLVPTGLLRVLSTIFGASSATTSTSEWLTVSDTATGTSSTDNDDSSRLIRQEGLFEPSSDGICQLRVGRNGTNSPVSIMGGGMIVESL